MNTENEIIEKLISGETVVVPDHMRKSIQKRLREIKKNCIIVLSQLNE